MTENITPVNLVDEMKTAYLDYSMAVLVGRAIPDLFDGLKPVTRRILTAMKWLGLKPDARYMKAARVEGETMGKLHPHSGTYGAMVTAASWWTNNHPLIDGHGNWGSPTDNAAAPRYTEAKLTEFAWEVLLQDSGTWVNRPNYDGSLEEPVQLNARLPLLLLNGAEGIGVGYSSKIPPHNLSGVAKALRALMDDDVIAAKNSLAPDFPTGCDIVKDEGLVEYLNTGVGSVRLRAKCAREQVPYGAKAKRTALVFTNLPIHVNTEQVGEQIKDGVESGKITTVADVRDETDRSGIRLTVVLKSGADVEQAESEIFRNTGLDTKFSARNLSIDGLKPVQLAPHEMLNRWGGWRDGRLVASLKAELQNRRERLEVVQGLKTATTIIEDIIDSIRRSKDRAEAKATLMKQDFSSKQADAILDMRLSQLTKLDEKGLDNEVKEIEKRIREIITLTSSDKKRREYILKEVEELAERFGNARFSMAIDPPTYKATEIIKVGRSKVEIAANGPKNRFVSVDEEKGILTQLKAPRGATFMVPDDQKLVFICDNGLFYKVAAKHKGPLASTPTKVLAKGSTIRPLTEVLAVWTFNDAVYANVLEWDSLTKVTSKGKRWLPEGAELIHLSPDPHEIRFDSKRKKPKLLSVSTVKARPVGGPGTKITSVAEISAARKLLEV